MSTLERLGSHRTASCSRRASSSLAASRPIAGLCTSRAYWASQQRLSVVAKAANASGNGADSSKLVICKPCMDAGLEEGVIDENQVITKFIAETILPTKHGKFRLRGYKHSIDSGSTFTEPTAIISGAVEGLENVPVRVHDACYTSEVLGSLKCDCAEQLALAMQMIHNRPPGMVIYLQQEGRGIGLANKIAAYSLQEQGLDTVDANRALGLPDDCREYTAVRNILRDLGIKSIQLITNNPRKLNVLTDLGISVSGRVPCVVEGGEFSKHYLNTKRDRMDHLLTEDESRGLDGSWCYWNHDGEPTKATPTAVAAGGMDLPNGVVAVDGRVLVDSAVGSAASAGSMGSLTD